MVRTAARNPRALRNSLGKAGQKAGRATAGGYFGDGLAIAARAILDDARIALTDDRLTDAEAVHDLRRAFKRWRSLMRLLTGPLGEPADRMRVGARDLMRALSSSRDAQAALDALADVGKSDLPFSATSRKTIETRLTHLRGEAEAAGFTPELRRSATHYIEQAALSLTQWPLAALRFDAIADELTATYRRARRRIPAHWLTADADTLHELRKRVVEYRHQLELVEPLQPRAAKVWAQNAQRLRGQLGACQDLTVLESFTALRGPLAPWRSKLLPLIRDRREHHLNAAARLAKLLFAQKPKAFRAWIGALQRARDDGTDQTPPSRRQVKTRQTP
ncbi:CHAD domain-containing protein [Undibacter mobilis]|uniref:CHAD domain-containing protein n=1 Tax=Undibacter mobilis TaxID=2292256 RepID=A0A371B7D3_9BRAD|nr:CHAD domain-containing protein [Undibacter mobilis]RDV03509.1 CHAD domain-containing protein [Undibacter mobilis]